LAIVEVEIVEDVSGNEGSYSGTLSLIGAMFRLAAQDYKFGRSKEVECFLVSVWFEEICEGMGLDVKEVRSLIKQGKVKHREEYQK
jgi:hypothetical protein